MQAKENFLNAVKQVLEEEAQEQKLKEQFTLNFFDEVQNEITTKINRETYKCGIIEYKKRCDFVEGKDMVDYNYLCELCKDNCLNVSWSSITPTHREFYFTLRLYKLGEEVGYAFKKLD